MLIVIQLQTLYDEINMLTKNYNYKEDKTNMGITEGVYSSTYSNKFIILTDTPAFELVIRAGR